MLTGTKIPPFTAICVSLLCVLCSFSSAGQQADAQLSLFLAIDERLAYMQDVALYKAQNRLPIEDLTREEIVINDARALATEHGLNADSMEGFFRAQMNAAKAIQYRHRAELLNGQSPLQPVDLESEIRPALDRLGNQIVRQFAVLLIQHSALQRDSFALFMSTLRHRLLADADREALFEAMLKVRRGP